jgi:phenylpyruvate tautomerase PptA (4-oxalocrotonate tautomerase family)
VPFARIDLVAGKSDDYRAAVADVVYETTVATLGAPKDDRFQVVSEYPATNFFISPTYYGIARTADAIVVQLTLSEGRTPAQKKAFYKALADGLRERVGLRREDVFINLVEVKWENWSFGNGLAQYAE